MPQLVLQPCSVNTGSGDEEGRLVLANGRLIAVLVLLADPMHGHLVGRWFLETGFGPLAGESGSLFDSLEAARNWLVPILGL